MKGQRAGSVYFVTLGTDEANYTSTAKALAWAGCIEQQGKPMG